MARVIATRAHALVGILFAESRFSRSESARLKITRPPESQHGRGEVFAMLVCIRQLAALDWRITLKIRRPSNAFSSFEAHSESELDNWFNEAKLMTQEMLKDLDYVDLLFSDGEVKSEDNRIDSPLEGIFSSSWGLSPLSTVLFRYANLRRKGQTPVHLDNFKFSKGKLSELGLPEFFVSWNVRQNPLYRLSSNPSGKEIISDFLALCRAQPLPIVLLSEPNERSRVAQILANCAETSELAQKRLITAKSINFWQVLQTVWSSQAYFQRRGGGAGMAAIYSSVPYVIIFPNRDLMGRLYLDHDNRITPWARKGLQIGLTGEPSTEHFRSAYQHLND